MVARDLDQQRAAGEAHGLRSPRPPRAPCSCGVDPAPIGPPLQPARRRLRVVRLRAVDAFDALAAVGCEVGFPPLADGPLVRSRCEAEGAFETARAVPSPSGGR
jgi:hypothetical protein